MEPTSLRVFDSWDIKSFNDLTTPTGIGTLVEISSKPCTFGGFELLNNDNSVRYLQVFFRPQSQIILGTTAPDMIFQFPSSDFRNVNIFPLRKGNGLSMAMATTRTGTTAATTPAMGAIYYKV